MMGYGNGPGHDEHVEQRRDQPEADLLIRMLPRPSSVVRSRCSSQVAP